MFSFRNPANIEDGDIGKCKGLYALVNALFIISWLLASIFNKASISDMDMDPEEINHENEDLSTDVSD